MKSQSAVESELLPLNTEEKIFNRCVSPVIDHPVLSWLIVLAITIIALVGQFNPDLLRRYFIAKPEAKKTESPAPTKRNVDVPEIEAFAYGSGSAIVVVQGESIFSPASSLAIGEVIKELRKLRYVSGLTWMQDAPPLNFFGLPEPAFPSSKASLTRFDAAKERAIANPLIGGQLLSQDGKLTLLMLEIDWFLINDEGDSTTHLREIAEQAAAKYPEAKLSFSVTGEAPIRLLTASAHESNEIRYQLIGYAVILLMAVVLFRGISAVLIVAIAPIVGVYWTIGVLHFFDLQDNPFNSAVLPVLLSMVGFTDGVHMISQIRRHRAAGMSMRDASKNGLREVGFACFLTSLTTAIGFGSLATAHHEIVRQFGWCCVIGVTLTFLAVILLIPLFCSSWIGKRVATGYGKNLVDRNLERISVMIDFVIVHNRWVSIGGILLTIGLLAICSTLRPDERQTSMLPDDAEAVIALRKVDKKLGGMDTGEVAVQWTDQVQVDAPEIGEVMQSIDELLRSDPLIGSPLSIYNLIQALPGDGPIQQRMSLLSLMPPALKRAFYTPEKRVASTQFRVQDLGIAKYNSTFRRIEAGLADIHAKHPQFDLKLEGNAIWRWKNLYQIVLDLCYSLGSAAFVIFTVLAIVYRSLRIGLIAVIPNIFPLATTGVLLVVTGQYLEIVSVCAFTVCLGIAVDDTIHFLTRYREERSKSPGDNASAIRRAFIGVGTALIMTTAVLIVGFSAALSSEARDTRVFVTMGMLTIASALIADLVFLPAMLAYFHNQRRSNARGAG